MTQFYKWLAGDMRHYDFTYKEGLNVDHVPFDPSGDCQPGGLYYTDFAHLPRWYYPQWSLIADVTVPDDARVYQEPCGTKWKADRLVLSNIRPLTEFLATLSETTLRDCVSQEPLLLRRMTLSEKTLYDFVSRDGLHLQHIENQSEAICLAAVQRDGWALAFVKNQTEAVCRAAVARTPAAVQFVKIPITF